MITLKINMLELKCSVKKMKAKSGEIDCLVIPIELNNLFVGEKGVYLDIVGFELKNPKEGSRDTHLLKQSFSKEIREKMTDDELKAVPILGNLAFNPFSERDPVSNPEPQPEADDLPFSWLLPLIGIGLTGLFVNFSSFIC